MGAIVDRERDSGENNVADAAVRAPCRIRKSPWRKRLTKDDFDGGAGAGLEEPELLESPPFLRFFRLVCFPIFN